MADLNEFQTIAAAAMAERNWPQALVACRQVLALQPRNLEAWNGIGKAYAALGRPADAAIAYAEALKLHADDGDATEGLATALLQIGQVEEAAAGFARIPERPAARSGLARLALARGDVTAAVGEAAAAVAMPSADFSCWRSYARALDASGNATAAVQALQQAIEVAGAPEGWDADMQLAAVELARRHGPAELELSARRRALAALRSEPAAVATTLAQLPPEPAAGNDLWRSWSDLAVALRRTEPLAARPPQAWPVRAAGQPRLAVGCDLRDPLQRYQATRLGMAAQAQGVMLAVLVPAGGTELPRLGIDLPVLPIPAEWTAQQLARQIADQDFDLILDWVGSADPRWAAALAARPARQVFSAPWPNPLLRVASGGAPTPFPAEFFRSPARTAERAPHAAVRIAFAANAWTLGTETCALLRQLADAISAAGHQLEWWVIVGQESEVATMTARVTRWAGEQAMVAIHPRATLRPEDWRAIDLWLGCHPSDTVLAGAALAHGAPVLPLGLADGVIDDGATLRGWLRSLGYVPPQLPDDAQSRDQAPTAWQAAVLAVCAQLSDERQRLAAALAAYDEAAAWNAWLATTVLPILAAPAVDTTAAELLARLRQGMAAENSGDPAAALAVYQALLAVQPASSVVLQLVAGALTAQGDPAAAAEHLRAALAAAPDDAEAALALADRYADLQQDADAVPMLEQQQARQPWHVRVTLALARAASRSGQHAVAQAAVAHALAMAPGFAESYFVHGLVQQRAGHRGGAFDAYQAAIALDPAHVEAHFNLGVIGWEMGHANLALASFDAVIQRRPDFAAAYAYRGEALYQAGRYDDWLANFDQYRRLGSKSLRYAAAALEAGQFRGDFDLVEQTIGTLRKGEFIADDAFELVDGLDQLLYLLQFFDVDDPTLGRLYRTYDRAMLSIYGNRRAADTPAAEAAYTGDRPLRVGYLGGDFRNHVMGRMLLSILSRHDPSRTAIFCYATDARRDATTAQFEALARFTDLAGLDEADAAARIAADQLDVLVECSGHTRGGKPGILALKPAPLIISHVAAAGHLGLSTVDFKLADTLTDLPTAQEFLVERLLAVEGCAYPFQPIAPTRYPWTREALGLKGKVVIGAFFTHLKLSRRCLMLWKRVLDQVPEAVLAFSPLDAGLKPAYLKLLAAAGIAAERAVFLPQGGNDGANQARYGLVDFVLDPLPHGGVNGTLEAISASVPVVTLVGRRHAERTSYSMLANLGVETTVAQNAENYVELAVRLARDPEFRGSVGAAMRDALPTSRLADMDTYVRNWEVVLQRLAAGQIGATADGNTDEGPE